MNDGFKASTTFRFIRRNQFPTEDGYDEPMTQLVLQQLWLKDTRVRNGIMYDIYIEDPYIKEWRDVPVVDYI